MTLWKKLRRLFAGERPFIASEVPTFDLPQLERLLDYHFENPELASLALTHRSLVRVYDGNLPSNERLEFLGDSVLGLVIADQLYRDHPDQAEGNLTKQKAMLVNEIALARVGTECGFNAHILLSADEERAGGRERPSIVSDAFEALIGAVYLDGGLEAARRMILGCVYSRRDDLLADTAQQNYKGDLLERVQATSSELPCYDVISESGPDHNKTFRVIVRVGARRLGEGTGSSKKDAEQKAARMALAHIDEQASE
jgi:ribonuclease-3